MIGVHENDRLKQNIIILQSIRPHDRSARDRDRGIIIIVLPRKLITASVPVYYNILYYNIIGVQVFYIHTRTRVIRLY